MLSKPARLLFGLTLPLFFYACGSPPPSSPTASTPLAGTPPGPYADGRDHSWVSTPAEASKLLSSLQSGAGSLGLSAQSVSLTLSASSGWGPIELNTSNGEQAAGDGRPITLNGKVYSSGLGVHADSEIRIQATGLETPSCTRFRADIGVDDEVGALGSVVFQVFANGRKVYDSGVMTGSTATKSIDVAVGNKNDLRFVVTNGGDNFYYDHADWADARLDCSAPQAPAGALDPSFGMGGQLASGGVASALEQDGSLLLLSNVNLTPTGYGNTQLRRILSNGATKDVVTDFGGADEARALVVQPDGKIVVVGNSDGNFAVARYLPDLTPDKAFGQGGQVITQTRQMNNGNSYKSEPYSAALQPDGKLIVVGSAYKLFTTPTFSTVSPDYAFVRYNTDGSLDDGFGTSGKVLFSGGDGFDPSKFRDETATDVAVQSDGKIVASGFERSGGGSAGTVIILLPSGSPDSSFGEGGLTVAASDYGYGQLNAVTLQPDGKILAAGWTRRFGADAIVVRLGAGGMLEQSLRYQYGAVNGVGGVGGNQFNDMLVQPDGRIVLGGFYAPQGSSQPERRSLLLRLNSDLSLDTSFGAAGTGQIDVPDPVQGAPEFPFYGVKTVLRQSDGKLIAVGQNTARFFP